MTKAAEKRLKTSVFFKEVSETVKAWDYYCYMNDPLKSNEMSLKWEMAKLALEHITGNVYAFSRDDETYSIVNESDYSDILITGKTASKC